jgi:hypothetical protein
MQWQRRAEYRERQVAEILVLNRPISLGAEGKAVQVTKVWPESLQVIVLEQFA